MKFQFSLIVVFLGSLCTGGATVVYSNSFDSSADLSAFTVFGETFITYTPPPLHSVSVDNGQLRIDTTYLEPNNPSPPVLFGRASLMLNTSSFGNGYQSVLSQSAGTITWSFNLSNQDGAFNNGFNFILASSTINPYDGNPGFGYVFTGGGLVGNRMTLSRFSTGIYGGAQALIDITDGLAPLPQQGSFKITYEPQLDLWSLYDSLGSAYVDPSAVNNLVGTAIDGTWTHSNTPFFGLAGYTTGSDFFDNVSVAVVPEPSAWLMVSAFSGLAFLHHRRRR
ncbi:MAG: hypothetical protein ABSE97_07910 [Verrucomicrobiota bacterium]